MTARPALLGLTMMTLCVLIVSIGSVQSSVSSSDLQALLDAG